MIPIHLDALHLGYDRSVVEAVADFTRLPYSDGQRDVNPDVPNLSEAIVSTPFQNQNLHLKAGLHLHWALPDTLTHGVHAERGTTFPTVPNRWLVRRSRAGTMEKQWVVESDYLYPPGTGYEAGSVSIPVATNPAQGQYQPFRYLGRNMPLAAWLNKQDPPAEYLNNLTAVGYGEPTFAAFYPNCHSVFGFHDDDYAGTIPANLRYDVIGWYNDPEGDFLKTFAADFETGYQGEAENLNEALWAALEEEASWTAAVDSTTDFPRQSLYYARLTFGQAGASVENPALNSPVTITVGNSSTEALSAYLAQTIDPNNKSIIEDQLEAFYLFPQLEQRQMDIGPKFKEARHEKGFTAFPAGSLWTIRPESESSALANAGEGQAQAQITLPEDMAHQLNALNLLQQSYDRAVDEIASMRHQLFADWYKYMLSCYPPPDSQEDYPDIDEVMLYIEMKDITPLAAKVTATGSLVVEQNQATGTVTAASTRDSAAGSLAAHLVQAINALLQSLATHNNNETVKQAGATYVLKQAPGPRYWQPTEPVVLMTGDAVKPTPRHGQDGRLRADGLLEGQVVDDTVLADLIAGNSDPMSAKIEQIASSLSGDHFAFGAWTEQPWHPFRLEWEVELFPARHQSNILPDSGGYGAEVITQNCSLPENEPDFSLKSGSLSIIKAANVYSGSTILSTHAQTQLQDRLEAYLKRELPDGFTPDNVETIEQNYVNDQLVSASDLEKAQDPIYTALRAYRAVVNSNVLAQSLGGFNEALLMHKLTRQVPIADPLAFEAYRPFAQAVSDSVQNSLTGAPQPLTDFNPIRFGVMNILGLRLVDTFGRVKDDLDLGNLQTAEPVTGPSLEYPILLRPRLAQPARLNFRWLSAGQGDQEMNDHPATTPICGWVMPNHLDNSLMIYDNRGEALGLINQLARWQPAPGQDIRLAVGDIGNPYLKQMVNYLLERGEAFLPNFMAALDNALEHIDPEGSAQHQGLALLIGRPIALVRANVNLEIQGLPAIHHGWHVFRQDLKRLTRETDQFTQVQFPIRLGEHGQLNDGLVGYWREAGAGYENNVFYTPQSDAIQDAYIKTHADHPMTILQTLDAPPQTLAMLIDPRGVVHATSGILPVKSISIPPDQYTPALQRINVTFLSTPVLTDRTRVKLPLPAEPGYQWSWLQKDAGGWSEVSTAGLIKKQVFLDAFDEGEPIWERLIAMGWLAEIDPTKASIVARDKRSSPDLGADLADKVIQIEQLLAQARLGPVDLTATFAGPQEIREGWLKLSHVDEAEQL